MRKFNSVQLVGRLFGFRGELVVVMYVDEQVDVGFYIKEK
jgi:hypothetical protein